MRLIDADELMEWLKNVTITDGIEFETGFKQILLDIKNQPTAYDLEEVVKALEELSDKADEKRKTALSKFDWINVNKEQGRMSAFEEAIEIVRQGGVK